MSSVSGPLVFHSDVRTYSRRIPPKARFSMQLLVAGVQQNRLPAIIEAMTLAGQLGLGKKRAKFRLLEVSQVGPNHVPVLIMTNGQIHGTGIAAVLPVPNPVGILRCTFITPWLLPENTSIEEGFNNYHFIMQAIRRITTLQQLYTGNGVATDFAHLKTLARMAEITDTDLTVEPGYRYPGKGKRFVAVRGAFILDLRDIPELWPWLWLSQWLHLPKLAGKGFGRYELAAIDE